MFTNKYGESQVKKVKWEAFPSDDNDSFYQSVQKLLQTKGIKVTINFLRNTPKSKIKRYLQRNFPKKKIIDFITNNHFGSKIKKRAPKRRQKAVFQPQNFSYNYEPLIDTSYESKVVGDSFLNSSNIYQHTPKQQAFDQWQLNSAEPLDEVNEHHEPLHHIPMFENILWGSEVFQPQYDGSPLWSMIQYELPEDYVIPDPDFVRVIDEKHAQKNQLPSPINKHP